MTGPNVTRPDHEVPVIVHPPVYNDTDGYQPGGLECPHCGALNTIVENDVAVRTNTFTVEAYNDGTPKIIGHQGVEGEFLSDSAECEKCGRAVHLDGVHGYSN